MYVENDVGKGSASGDGIGAKERSKRQPSEIGNASTGMQSGGGDVSLV